MKLKKLLSLALATSMTIALLPIFTLTAFATDETEKNITLGTEALSKYENGYDYIYYGTHENNPIKWRLLDTAYRYDKNDTSKTGMLLLSEYVLEHISFGADNIWEGSAAQGWCEGMYSFAFGKDEKSFIVPTKSDDILSDTLNYDRLFFLSKEEAENSVYFPYKLKLAGENLTGVSVSWWLRSPNNDAYSVYVVAYSLKDTISNIGINAAGVSSYLGARPAFTLDSSKILFTSDAVGGKTVSVGTLSKNVESITSEYKLTMKDEARSDFAIKDPDNETAAVITKSVPRGETVSFKYENAETGENEYISAMLVKDGEVLRYGQLAKPEAANGNVEFTIPSDIDYGTYELRLFNEQINGDYEADFASDFTTVTLEVGLSGGGTTENPYLINGLEDLEYFRNMVNSGKTDICAKLMNDITVNPGTFADDGSYTSAAEENLKAWTPIGLIKTEFVADNEKITLETVKNIYTGTFDGNGKTISGIYLNNAGSDYMGLFGVVGGSAKIKNLTLKNSYINGRSCVGGIVGYAKPEQIKEESDSEYIVTNKTATVSITDCRSEAVVCGTENVGGIVGRAELAEQTNDIVSAGKKNALDIQNCSNAGKIKCTDSNAGGIIGSVDVSGGVAAGVEQCANTGKVNGEKSVGGVVGSANVTAVTTTKTQKIPVISSSGGLTFKEERVTASDGSSFAISDCYNTAVIHGTEDVGGIAGRAYLTYSGTSGSIMVEIPDDGVQEISFSCCFNIGKVTARTTLDSGIAGYAVYNSVLMTKPQMLTAVADCYYQAEKAEVGMSGYGTELS